MTARDPEPQSTTPGRDHDREIGLFHCLSCRRFTRTLIEDRGWCSRDGSQKLIEVRSYMKYCWQARS